MINVKTENVWVSHGAYLLKCHHFPKEQFVFHFAGM